MSDKQPDFTGFDPKLVELWRQTERERLARRRLFTPPGGSNAPPIDSALLEAVVWPAVDERKEKLGIKPSEEDDLAGQLAEAHKSGKRDEVDRIIYSRLGMSPSKD